MIACCNVSAPSWSSTAFTLCHGKCFLQKSYLGVELALTQYAAGPSFVKLHFLVKFIATQLKVIKEFLVDGKILIN